MLAFIAALVVLLSYYVFSYYQNVRRYPRGPRPFPFIGNLFHFEPHRLHVFMKKCSEEYGNVFTVWMPRPMVCLMNYDDVKQAFATQGDEFAGRMGRFPDNLFQNIPNGGVIFSQGAEWKEQRRTAITILRDFGMGKNVMEEQVHVSIDDFMNHLNSIEDKSRVDFRWPIQILVANVINNILYGYYYKHDSCQRLMKYADVLTNQIESMRKNVMVFLIMQFPFLASVPVIGWYGCEQYKNTTGMMRNHVVEDIDKCQKEYHGEPSCFVHAYMQKAETNASLTNDQMINVCLDFFLAGMETTSTTLRWGMLHMANNLDVQDKIRAEIHSVIGKDRNPNMADKLILPYTTAAVHELQRMSNILPLNVMHRTVCDTKISGHPIPEDTLVMGQIYHILSESSVYKNPKEFRPERFLMADGKTPNKETLEQLIPFSIGKRQCAGEGLARMELFLCLSAIVQKYRILPPKDGTPVDISPVEASILLPKTNYLQLVPVA